MAALHRLEEEAPSLPPRGGVMPLRRVCRHATLRCARSEQVRGIFLRNESQKRPVRLRLMRT